MKLCGTEPTLSQLAEGAGDEPWRISPLAIQAAQPAMSLTPEKREEGDRQMDIPVESPEEELADTISLAEVIESAAGSRTAADPPALLGATDPERDCKGAAYHAGADLPAGAQDTDPAAGPAFGRMRSRNCQI